jgi:hypothetical protein
MTSFDENVLSRVMDVRAEVGIRRAVDGTGADVGRILDSRSVRDAVNAIDAPAVQDYDTAVAETVRRVIDGDPARFRMTPAQPPAPGQQAAEGPRQWTVEDVDKSTATELTAAMNSGLLQDIGCAPPRNRRRR